MLPETLYLDAVNTVYQALSETYTPIAPKYLKGKRGSIVDVLQRLLPGAIEGRLEDAAPPEQDSGQTGRNAKEPKSDRGKKPTSPEAGFALAKVEVAKVAISLLRDRGVLNQKGELRQEYRRFADLFKAMKKHLKA